MRHADQRALVLAPAGTSHADEAVIRTLGDLHQVMGQPKHGKQMRRGGRAVTEIPHARIVGHTGVEMVIDITGGKLGKGARVDGQAVEHGVDAREKVRPDVAEEHVRRGTSVMWRRDRRQTTDTKRRRRRRFLGRTDATDQVPRVETAHAVRDDVDVPPARAAGDLLRERGGALFNGPCARDGRRDAFDVVA